MGFSLDRKVPSDEIVDIRPPGPKQGDPSVITINCPDQLGLGADLTRILFEFGLVVVRGDLSTDGRWCFVIFWVTPRAGSSRPIKWALLKKRLISTCPSTIAHLLLPHLSLLKPKKTYVLQAHSLDRVGLLNDVAQTIWELELTIHKMKATTSPDGKAVNMFYVTDSREMLHERKRQEDVCDRLKSILGETSSGCEIRQAGPEWGTLDCTPFCSLSPSVAEELFNEGLADLETDVSSVDAHSSLQKVCVTLDNSLSPGHTLLQIACQDRKGLLYDCMRVLKDFHIQVAYGRLFANSKKVREIDLFILQRDGHKILDPQKQKTLCSRLEMEIVQPVRVLVVNRGPDTELLVATPVDISGRGRPQVLYDITSVLKTFDICIFQADIGRHVINEQQWEIYRVLFMERPELASLSSHTQSQIAEQVRTILIA